MSLQTVPNLCARCATQGGYALKGIDYELAYRTGRPCDNCGETPKEKAGSLKMTL